MRDSVPTVVCDGDDGYCEAWAIDSYQTGMVTLGGVLLTAQHRAFGWVSTDDTDLCPEHAEGPR